jgi:predicted permease
MGGHHRHKQKTLTGLITAFIFLLAMDAFFLLRGYFGNEFALLFAFTVAIGLTVVYQCYNYKHSHEHYVLVNTLSQMYLGILIFVCCTVMILLIFVTSLPVLDAYVILSFLVLLMVALLHSHFHDFIEREVSEKFPIGKAPKPKHAPKKKKKRGRRS